MESSRSSCDVYVQTNESIVTDSSRTLTLLRECIDTPGLLLCDLRHEAPVRGKDACTYCGELVSRDARITIEGLNIFCHPSCFKCGICSRPMGDLLYNMFLRRGTVHCESCYTKIN